VVVGSTPRRWSASATSRWARIFPGVPASKTHEEYALARTERKSGRGSGLHRARRAGCLFFPKRRLCWPRCRDSARSPARAEINANATMVRHAQYASAQAHQRARAVLYRHAGLYMCVHSALARSGRACGAHGRHGGYIAFQCEDPVRILRVARFGARFGFRRGRRRRWALMKRMVGFGETDYLVPERVWQEFSKGLMEREPQRMFEGSRRLRCATSCSEMAPSENWRARSPALRALACAAERSRRSSAVRSASSTGGGCASSPCRQRNRVAAARLAPRDAASGCSSC